MKKKRRKARLKKRQLSTKLTKKYSITVVSERHVSRLSNLCLMEVKKISALHQDLLSTPRNKYT
jgi:hypothetical protein